MFLGLTFLRNFAFELLAGDLVADQPGEGELSLLLILSRLTAIVSIIPCPERAGDMEAWNAKLKKVSRHSVR